MRGSGVLMPVFSLPGSYGIGCFSNDAYRFVDFLEKAGQRYWQMLPLVPTGFGNSPYQSPSAFAGNPLFICPDGLAEYGLIKKSELKSFKAASEDDRIDYEKQNEACFQMLELAFKGFDDRIKVFRDFTKKHKHWLDDYALFMVIKENNDYEPFWKWDSPLKERDASALAAVERKYKKRISFYKFIQYVFYSQWQELKKYANSHGVEIIGDIPIYVAADSADVWAGPRLFALEEELSPRLVAGCPPDGFSRTGQLWGNPVYDWSVHREDGYQWWIRRMRACMELYDVVRIDHFRAFDEYYAIPAGNETAEYGEWMKGPGMELFEALGNSLGSIRVIAEDLGQMTDTVKQLVRDSGFPGMHLLEFAFYKDDDNLSDNGTSNHLPLNYEHNSVVYPGTHDNETIMGWLGSTGKRTKSAMMHYIGAPEDASDEYLCTEMIRLAQASVADYALIPMADWLGLDNRARINSPGTTGSHNWTWRMQKGMTTARLAKRMKDFAVTYGRI